MSRSMYVYHTDDEIVHDVMDGVLYSVPPGEPFEFTNPFIGKKFIEHKWFHGVVEVELERTRAGWIFKLEDAHARSIKALEIADSTYSQSYIETQHQDRLASGRPAMPPSARQRKILQRQGVNLEDYGIIPIGTRSSQEKMFADMVQQNNQMMQMIAALITGQQISPAASVGAARRVSEPTHTDHQSGEQVLVPRINRPIQPPRDVVAPASAVQERPDPVSVRPLARLYNEGEEPVVTDPSLLGPEFEGDVNDPNQMPGPRVPAADRPLDLHEAGLADALNMEEDRVRLNVPSPDRDRDRATKGPVKLSKTRVQI